MGQIIKPVSTDHCMAYCRMPNLAQIDTFCMLPVLQFRGVGGYFIASTPRALITLVTTLTTYRKYRTKYVNDTRRCDSSATMTVEMTMGRVGVTELGRDRVGARGLAGYGDL